MQPTKVMGILIVALAVSSVSAKFQMKDLWDPLKDALHKGFDSFMKHFKFTHAHNKESPGQPVPDIWNNFDLSEKDYGEDESRKYQNPPQVFRKKLPAKPPKATRGRFDLEDEKEDFPNLEDFSSNDVGGGVDPGESAEQERRPIWGEE